MNEPKNNYEFEDHYIDEWCFKEEAHYHHTIQDVAELVSVYGWQQVLHDINQTVGWAKTKADL